MDFVRADGRWQDLQYLLDMIENDPDPGIRHQIVCLLIHNPPFDKAHRQKLDIPEVIERIWSTIK